MWSPYKDRCANWCVCPYLCESNLGTLCMHFTRECTTVNVPTYQFVCVCACVRTLLCLCVFSCGPKVPLQ